MRIAKKKNILPLMVFIVGISVLASIQSIQIAPDGIVTDIYPEEGNEAGRIDLCDGNALKDVSKKRTEAACMCSTTEELWRMGVMVKFSMC